MIAVLVGHRGTGKTALMARIQRWLEPTGATFFDLDQVIEEKLGRSIGELFLVRGEEYFRDLERQLFHEIIQREHQSAYICLGAGFDLSILPPHVEVIWIRRETDLDGRIFLNRPRLNPNISPLEEFKKRAEVRERLYQEKATRVYTMPEGIFDFKQKALAIEKEILSGEGPAIGGSQTILKSHLRNEIAWASFKNRFVGKKILFELRNDLLSEDDIRSVLRDLDGEKFIYSFRAQFDFSSLPVCSLYDWPLENPDMQSFLHHVPIEKRIFSLHEKNDNEDILGAIERLNSFKGQGIYLKLSLQTNSFAELELQYRWQQQDRLFHSILPRSEEGRWNWFRLFMKSRQFINFWREGDGSAIDQPTLFQWLATPGKFTHFAAVLGDPIRHSFSPLEHLEYFAKMQTPFWAVRLPKAEWAKAFPLLQEWGLRWAAVTAPLKEVAAEVATTTLNAVNTLCFADGQWFATSTDGQGFLELIEGVGALAPLQSQIVVWGGGGVLEMLREALPRAIYFSSRSAQPRDGVTAVEKPPVLIWAAPRQVDTLMPPVEWKPALVIDLNYKEDSMGREYAQKCDTNYTSGLQMFLTQAQGQKSFWNRVHLKFGDQ